MKSQLTEESLKEEKLINAIKLLHQNDNYHKTKYKDISTITKLNIRNKTSSYFGETVNTDQTDGCIKRKKSEKTIFCDCHRNLLDVEMKQRKFDDCTMGLLLCCSKKIDDEEDNDTYKRKRRTRKNTTQNRNTARSTAKETSTLTSSDVSKIGNRYRDTAATTSSTSIGQSTFYSTIPEQTNSFYDNVPYRSLGSQQDKLNTVTFTENEISTIQKPILTYIAPSSSKSTKNSKSFQYREDTKSSFKTTKPESQHSYKSPSKLGKLPDAQKMTVVEINQNNTTAPIITKKATSKSVEIIPRETCYSLDSINSNQAHSVDLKTCRNKIPKNQYQLSNANEVIQTTAKYLEANSTVATASSPVKNKFPISTIDQFYKPTLLTENTGRESRKTKTNLYKPYSVYDNVPVSTSSLPKITRKSVEEATLTPITSQPGNSKSLLDQQTSEQIFANDYTSSKNKEGTHKTVQNYPKYEQSFKDLESDITSQFGNAKNVLYPLDQTYSNQIFTRSKNEDMVKDVQSYSDIDASFSEAKIENCNVADVEQLLSSHKEESSNHNKQNISLFPQHSSVFDDAEHIQPTFASKVLEAEYKAIETEDEIKLQKEINQKKVITKLEEVHIIAKQFKKEIDNFEESQDSSKQYYIEESLQRLVETLDNMYEDIGEDEYLRAERKKVYKCIFPLFDKLDEKVNETT